MRLVLTSDLHGDLPDLPNGDLLLVAGDICPDFVARAPQRAWFIDKFLAHLTKAGWEDDDAYVTYGNHDWLPRPSAEWGDLTGNTMVKIDELVETHGLKIWFSPWSNQFGHWAWMDQPYNLANKYAIIPEGVDIIVSHQPPFGFGDMPDERYYMGDGPKHVGSHELLEAVSRLKPKLVVCGHIHGGYGSYEWNGTTIMNVSHMNEAYQPVNEPVVLDWDTFIKEK